MSPRRRKRLDSAAFQLPADRIKAGDFSDRGAALAASVLPAAKKNARVLLQVTTKQGGHLSGIDESIAILKCGVEDWSALTVHALYEGDRLDAWDTVMTIEGDYAAFAHLETLYLGVLAHRTLICSNIREIVDIARTKAVFFFGARDEHFLMQPGDGFAATIGGAKQVCTPAQASLGGAGNLVSGTVHHSLIAAFGGDAAAAAKHLAKQLPDEARLLALVDYDNDVTRASVQVAEALGERLWGVRLDTSENLVDKSLLQQLGTFRPTGVNSQLVWNVRNALDADGFGDVRIVVSGGFDAERVQEFEEEGVPVDAYGIGSAAYQGCYDFIADVVQVGGKHQARTGRKLRPNPKLERVK
jgi:nicotinate phosphoribosyltransferase